MNLTKEEVIKALIICSSKKISAPCPPECPMNSYYCDCFDFMQKDILEVILSMQEENEALIEGQETLQLHISNQNKEISRLSLLAKLGEKRADDYRTMRDRALKAEEEVVRLKKEIEHNYEIRRKANGLVKSIEEKLPMCYEEHRVMGINQMFKEAEGMSEVIFGDVAVRLSDLKIIQEEMVACAKIATTTETEGE